MESGLLTDIVVTFAFALVAVFVCHRLRIPTIVGFLLTGMLVGPGGLKLVLVAHEANLLAEIGVVLLLFTIGLELSLQTLSEMKTAVLLGGTLQVAATVLAGMAVARAGGGALGQSVFVGCFIALSSTAIVLKLLQERGEVEAPHGRTALGILIFQDIAVVPMVLLMPLLAGGQGNAPGSVLVTMGKAVLVVAVVVVAARWLVPRLLFQAARLRDRELFLLSVVVIGIGIAWLTSSVGLSLALGAFLAGLIISESEYGHRALGDILPFRDVFTSFFFISVGMLLDVGFVARHPLLILSLASAVVVGKAFLAGLASLVLRASLRTAILTGLALAQVGEFSFVLLKEGLDVGLLNGELYQTLIAVCVCTMLATPFVIAAAPHVAEGALRFFPARRLPAGGPAPAGDPSSPRDHLVIVGFGLNGQNLARAAAAVRVPYVIIEMNPETVRRMKSAGEPIFYGDATQQAVLEHAGIGRARVLVVAISDPAATRRAVELGRRLSPSLHIIARTRFVTETEALHRLGANEVIPEEFETSVEIFTRVMMSFLVSRDEIDRFVAEVRAHGYQILRKARPASSALSSLRIEIPDVEISMLRVSEPSPLVGKSLAALDLRKQYGITLLAIRRDSETISNPSGSVVILARDTLIVLGKPEQIPALARLCHNPQSPQS